ncbi:MAG: TldD/PmbA family protein [Mariprofundaceae bacterium]
MTHALEHTAMQLVDMVKNRGAAHADAVAISNCGESVSVRQGNVESVEREDSRGVGLRAFVDTAEGFAFATASTSDLSETGLSRLVDQTFSMAKVSTADPDSMPPIGANHPSTDALATWEQLHKLQEPAWNMQSATTAALACEEAALAVSNKISNSEGASSGFGEIDVAYAASDDFSACYHKGSASLSVSVIAGNGNNMQRDYAYDRALRASTLRSPDSIGIEAAERTLKRIGSQSISSRECAVVFEPRIAASLLSHLAGGINGRAVLQQRSFLSDSVGQQIFPEFIHIIDNPNHENGLGNRLFDGEGTHCKAMTLIEDGQLTGFLADRYAAQRLGTAATGHAKRGLTGDIGIGTSNLIMQPGSLTPQALCAEIGDGIFITELMGFGVNAVTGDYSRGAAGFLIENGKISSPVNEITIAGNLKKMFANISHLGNDLTWFGSAAVPTIAIETMVVAGQD